MGPKNWLHLCHVQSCFESNAAARKLWESLNFKRAGKIKSAAYVKNFDQPVDAIIYGRELADKTVAESSAYRFDKIRYYLETGKYPATADRQEKPDYELVQCIIAYLTEIVIERKGGGC